MAFPTATTTEGAVSTAGTSHAITLPGSGVATDEYLILMSIGSTAATLNALTDWTELLDENLAIGLKILRWTGTGVPSNPTFTSSASTRSAWVAYKIAGADKSVTPQIGSTASGSSTTPDPPAITPTSGVAKDYLSIAFCGSAGEQADDDTYVTSFPTNYTLYQAEKTCGVAGTNLGGMIGTCAREINSGSSIDPGTFTVSENAGWRAQHILVHPIIPKTTSTARISLAAAANDPATRTQHKINVRARKTNAAHTGTIRVQLYEGANARSSELETSALTTSLAAYSVNIADADAANITSYADLEIRVRGYASLGDATVFEIAQLELEIPAAAATPKAGTDSSSAVTEQSGKEVPGVDSNSTATETSALVFSPSATDANATATDTSSKTDAYTTSDQSATVTEISTLEISESKAGTDTNSIVTETSQLDTALAGTDISSSVTETSSLDESITTSDSGTGNEVSGDILIQTSDANSSVTESSSKSAAATSTSTASISLATGYNPLTRTQHKIILRARKTNAAHTGSIFVRLYEGATPRSADLEVSSLTDALADYTLNISDGDAATITSYADLELQIRATSAVGDPIQVEVANIYLETPQVGLVASDNNSFVTESASLSDTEFKSGTDANTSATETTVLVSDNVVNDVSFSTTDVATLNTADLLSANDASSSTTETSSSTLDNSLTDASVSITETPVITNSAVASDASASIIETASLDTANQITASDSNFSATETSASTLTNTRTDANSSVTDSSSLTTGGTTTATARISLAPGLRPLTRTLHKFILRARKVNGAHTGSIFLRLYEGATPITPELEVSTLTTSLANYEVNISDANAAAITSYSDLEVRVRAASAVADPIQVEIARIELNIPQVGLIATDSASGTDTSSLAIITPKTANDASTAVTETSNVIVGVTFITASDTSTGTETDLQIEIDDSVVDGTGVDVVSNLNKGVSDSASGVETSSLFAGGNISTSDSGTGINSVTDRTLTALGDINNIVTETSSLVTITFKTGTDSATGNDISTLARASTTSDSATGADNAVLNYTLVTRTDSATGADISSLITSNLITVNDSGSSFDFTSARATNISDSAVSSESKFVLVLLTKIDSSLTIAETYSLNTFAYDTFFDIEYPLSLYLADVPTSIVFIETPSSLQIIGNEVSAQLQIDAEAALQISDSTTAIVIDNANSEAVLDSGQAELDLDSGQTTAEFGDYHPPVA